jgi:hypothetical protein
MKTCDCEGCNSILPYRPGTTLEQILTDGWARGFAIPQTYDEAKEMGFIIKPSEIMAKWQELDAEMIADFEGMSQEIHNVDVDAFDVFIKDKE